MSEKIAFEPFGSLDGVLRGEPVKIFPVGTFYRDDRKLTLTPERLRQVESNFKAGLPRFRIPINENHSGVGKVGTVKDIAYLDTALDGPGLYATEYELTDEGRRLIEQKRFDATSGEIVWGLNGGAKYQDPQTGKHFDNVLVGLALTDKPFFGHDHVALFSADPQKDDEMADEKPTDEAPAKAPKRKNGYTALRESMRDKFEQIQKSIRSQFRELEDLVKDEDGDGEPDAPKEVEKAFAQMGGYVTSNTPYIVSEAQTDLFIPTIETTNSTNPIVINVSPTSPVAARDIAEAIRKTSKGVDKMADETIQATAAPEKLTATPVSAEEFAAIKAEAAALKTQAEKFATELAETKRARRLDQLKSHVESFMAVPDGVESLAEKFMALEEKDAELYKYFDNLIATYDRQLSHSELFTEKASARTGGGAEDLNAVTMKIVKEKFDGDMGKYAEALHLATAQRPDLATDYLRSAPKA